MEIIGWVPAINVIFSWAPYLIAGSAAYWTLAQCTTWHSRSDGPHPSPRSVVTKRRILLGCVCFGSLAGFETAEQD